MDTGASSHMSSNAGKLNSSTLVYNSPPIIVGNGTKLPVTHRASTHIPTTRSPLSLPNVLVSPSLVKNLISVCSLTRDNNVSVEFDAFGFSVKDLPTHSVILLCNSDGELYPLAPSPPEALTTTVTSTPTIELWHQRLGHPGRHTLQQNLPCLEFISTKPATCEACQLGKHVRLPFSDSSSVSYVPFQIVHADVWTSLVHLPCVD